MQIRVLDHLLDRKSLTPFSGAGVYVFLAAERKLIEDKLSHPALLLQVLRDELEVCYVGKAKHLNQRLQTYRGAGSASAGDWHKTNKLAEMARSVLLVPTPSHFEACLLELLLIRILDPKLNYMSTRAGKLYFVQQDSVAQELSASTRRRPKLKTWGCMRLKSELRAAFEAFNEGLEFYDPEAGVLRVRPADSSFRRVSATRRFSLHVNEKNYNPVVEVLRGKRTGLMEALWRSMRYAAEAQQFHQAAHLRDLFLSLRQLQFQLRRSRKIMRRLRNNHFVIGLEKNTEKREYVLRRYTISSVSFARSSKLNAASHFESIMSSAIEIFKTELDGEGESERLRVNFEFLRLMLWWLDNQPEDCVTRSAQNARPGCTFESG